jgi:hypothetical protein
MNGQQDGSSQLRAAEPWSTDELREALIWLHMHPYGVYRHSLIHFVRTALENAEHERQSSPGEQVMSSSEHQEPAGGQRGDR